MAAPHSGGDYPRDLIGYGPHPPDPRWPGGARLAVQFVLNYEEGGENCVLHGDAASESFLSEMVGAEARPGVRHMSMESLYEYGSRVGLWRLMRLFRRYRMPLTVFAVGMAAERHPDAIRALVDEGHEICSHGYRWIDYQYVPEAEEAEHIGRAVEALTRAAGAPPLGWYTGRTSPNTRRLVVEHGGFLYDADDYNDELPFWTRVADRRHLVVPYTLDVNDMRFSSPAGFNNGEQYFNYLRDSFDYLYQEGAEQPRMLSVGLHCRLAGRPGRAAALEKFLKHVSAHRDVWVTRRIDIARHWMEHHG
ncbi:hypothetical protein Y5W_01421 [Alcanivorax sp. 521-1]|uniref:NodB homology domain-containing protein n=1 Tax=Alloalcanivorax profundimaris TaxID=2735259 RepID=A0ABS0APR9_9GAMM|nr:allantoinase PuuE [Alloalcanivorax profundimaris]MBF5056127.1 hypothetical protein [Alloalcanivorax profundimaris]